MYEPSEALVKGFRPYPDPLCEWTAGSVTGPIERWGAPTYEPKPFLIAIVLKWLLIGSLKGTIGDPY